MALKVNKHGYEPFTGQFSTAAYSTKVGSAKEALSGFDRLDKGFTEHSRMVARSLHGSIYNENNDPKQRDHLLTLPGQIESVNP